MPFGLTQSFVKSAENTEIQKDNSIIIQANTKVAGKTVNLFEGQPRDSGYLYPVC